jgi:hypothetical protein
MHKYKLVFKMADGSEIKGDSTAQKDLEQYTQNLAQSERNIFLNSNGVQATIVNMRHVAAVDIREVWS